MTSNSYLKLRFNISSVRVVGAPVPHAPFGSFDRHGLFLGLSRLRSEDNPTYRRRLREVFSRRANSTYRGLVNAITRDLGLEFYYTMWINPKINSAGDFIAPDPYIRFEEAYLYLYSDYQNGVLDAKIDRYEPGGRFELLTRLNDRINLSPYFQSGSYNAFVDMWGRSMCILNQTNREEISLEEVPASTKFRLKHLHICPGTIYFNDRNIFETEVDNSGLVNARGKFHIDYTKGIVTVYSIPSPATTVRYFYTVFPFKAIASPVILNSVASDDFRDKMFSQILQEDGMSYEDGTPTPLGVEIIRELLSVYPMYWGA